MSTSDPWPLPRALEAGPWVNAETGLSRAELEAAPTLVVRWRAGDRSSVATLAAAGAHPVRALGLHVPGHPREQEVQRVRHAVLREGVHAPVRQDADGALARALQLHAPGDAVLLDEDAQPVARARGRLPDVPRELDASTAGPGAPGWDVRGEALGPDTLAYPQGLAVREGAVAISDTAHHRVLVRNADGAVGALGSGAPGHGDGARSRARFSRPRGLAWTDETLVVADAGNGALRSLDPTAGRVSTLVEARALDPAPEAPHGPMPTDLAPLPGSEGVLAVSLASRGVLARVDAAEGRVLEPLEVPELEQPAGVAAAGARLYVADPGAGELFEVSTKGDAHAVADRETSPLEHPVAVAARDDAVCVADAYADALFRVHPDEGSLERVEARGALGRLVEPRALAALEDAWLTAGADHRLRRVDPDAVGTVHVEAPGEPGPAPIRLDPVEVAPGGTLVLELAARGVPDPEALDPGRPSVRGPAQLQTVDAFQARSNAVWAGLGVRVEASGALVVRWPVHGGQDAGELAWRLAAIVRPGGDQRVELRLTAPVDDGGGPGGRGRQAR